MCSPRSFIVVFVSCMLVCTAKVAHVFVCCRWMCAPHHASLAYVTSFVFDTTCHHVIASESCKYKPELQLDACTASQPVGSKLQKNWDTDHDY